MTPNHRHCGRCHTCGAQLRPVLDGEEWCPHCQTYRRYRSHDWSLALADPDSATCPDWPEHDEPPTQ